MNNVTTLVNLKNYGVYAGLANNEKITINTGNITLENYESYYSSLLNIFKDGIETEQVQSYMIEIQFVNGPVIQMSLFDYWLNLVMWFMVIATDRKITSKFILFADEIKQDTIKDYIDENLIDVCRKTHTNMDLNNIIDDTLRKFHDLDKFAFYLSNTVNLEDNIFLMKENPEFWECMHANLANVPIEDVKAVGMQYANKAIDIMKHSKHILGYDHCLADAWRASEGINPKQFKEFTINIGTKPDGRGGVYPAIINHSFINGGVATPEEYLIESSVGRTAQIIKYNNVGSSGHFARLLGLNNMDSFLYPTDNYDCHSKHFVEVIINDKNTLKLLNNRYYRLHPIGMENIIHASKDHHLIGKKIYLRSPITCASAARGHGICYKCYGDLAYTVFNLNTHFGINIGRIASEILSSKLTQLLLSAKHMLESSVQKLSWVKAFTDYFEISFNVIHLLEEIEDTKFQKMIIDPNAIELENEEDEDLSSDDESAAPIYNEYVVEFDVLNEKTGETFHICNDKLEKLYFSRELNNIIRKKAEPVDGKIVIHFDELAEIPLFIVPISNNELSKTLDHLQALLNKNSTIKGKTYSELLQEVLETIIEGGMKVASIHLEVIISNQIRDAYDVLEKPNWDEISPEYQILSLNKALTDNPSVVISLSYQKISKQLYNPLTYRKHKPSFMDLFFMERPQLVIRDIDTSKPDYPRDEDGLFDPLIRVKGDNKITVAPVEEIDYNDQNSGDFSDNYDFDDNIDD